MVNGKGVVHQQSVMRKWLIAAATTQFSAFSDVADWVIESLKRGGALGPSFHNLHELTILAFVLADAISPSTMQELPDRVIGSYPGLASRIAVFKAGERERAARWLETWVASHVVGYVKVVDPYFRPSDLVFFRSVPPGCRVLVVTTDQYMPTSGGREALAATLLREWNAHSASTPPAMQILVVPQSQDKLFHDRAIVTRDAGLDLGQSLNHLGAKDGRITELDEINARELELKFVDPLLNQASWFLEYGASAMVVYLP
jgi:hypothetical protein